MLAALPSSVLDELSLQLNWETYSCSFAHSQTVASCKYGVQ